ncbi:MAG TPA: histidine kinase, partial [Ferruginibacter sp.]|nr:histidine kinase [Ferruginibacter sp.]
MDAHQTQIFTAIIIAASLIGGILLLLVILLVRQQRRNAALYLSKIDAEMRTLENERQRVAVDLHDELGPILAAIKFKLSSINTPDSDDAIELEESHELLNDVINRLRGIANDLMPVALLKKGILVALTGFLDKMRSTVPVTIDLEHTELPILSPDYTITLFRIIQEIIHNTLKHSQ